MQQSTSLGIISGLHMWNDPSLTRADASPMHGLASGPAINLPDSGLSILGQDEREAFRLYTEKFGECRDGSNPGATGDSINVCGLVGWMKNALESVESEPCPGGYSRKAFPWFTGKAPQAAAFIARDGKQWHVSRCSFFLCRVRKCPRSRCKQR